MFIPLRTDRPPRRHPLATESLIVLNLLVYLAGLLGTSLDLFDRSAMAEAGQFAREPFRVWALVTYQFLHDPFGIGHLAFNMLFLWVFGCPVEDRLGRLWFILFYLGGGACSALVHAASHPAPVIGASGSIAAVTGAFLALFPRSRIRVIVFLTIMDLPAPWVIGVYVALDCIRQTTGWLGLGGSHVAYAAHIAGYAYGFLIAFSLLGLGVLKHEEFDVFYLFRQARRRAAFRAASRPQVGGLWDSASADTTEQLARRPRKGGPPGEIEHRHAERRANIHRLVGQHRLAEAAAAYRQLLGEDPRAVLSEQSQLDVGNQLYADGDPVTAARAYELLLEHYRSSTSAGEVGLMLGLLYAQQPGARSRARELIRAAREKLVDPAQLDLADRLLQELVP